MDLPRWIRSPDEVTALARSLSGAGALAIDTEADSLHHYPGKLCLVQIADDRGHAHLVDPLALSTLAPLAPLFADAGLVKIFHAADNDLAYLKRLYGFTVASFFDTSVAARFLGVPALGLEGLLQTYLGEAPGKSRQKDDWSRRPLSAEQEEYALNDVRHLFALREHLLEELRAKGRDAWAEEECAALAALAVPDKAADPDAYLGLKGAKDLDQRGLGGAARAAPGARVARARAGPAAVHDHRPRRASCTSPGSAPTRSRSCSPFAGFTARVAQRAGRAVLEAIARGEALPDDRLPTRRLSPRPARPRGDPAARRGPSRVARPGGARPRARPGRAVSPAAHRSSRPRSAARPGAARALRGSPPLAREALRPRPPEGAVPRRELARYRPDSKFADMPGGAGGEGGGALPAEHAPSRGGCRRRDRATVSMALGFAHAQKTRLRGERPALAPSPALRLFVECLTQALASGLRPSGWHALASPGAGVVVVGWG